MLLAPDRFVGTLTAAQAAAAIAAGWARTDPTATLIRVASSPEQLAASLARPAQRLMDLAERVARSWSRL